MEKLTKDELAVLSRHADNINRALNSDYCRNVGSMDLDELNGIWERITGEEHPINKACGACTLDLLKRLGQVWRAQVESENKARTAEYKTARKTAKK